MSASYPEELASKSESETIPSRASKSMLGLSCDDDSQHVLCVQGHLRYSPLSKFYFGVSLRCLSFYHLNMFFHTFDPLRLYQGICFNRSC